MIKKDELFQIGYFAKPHGVKGELSLYTRYEEIVDSLDRNDYLVCEIDGIYVPFFIETLRSKSASVVFVKLEHVNDEIGAKKFSNKTVYCSLNLLKSLPVEEQKQSWSLFVGYELADNTIGVLGEIMEVDESTINTLFKIDYQGQELLVPVAEELVVAIDQESRRFVIALPEGLIDL